MLRNAGFLVLIAMVAGCLTNPSLNNFVPDAGDTNANNPNPNNGVEDAADDDSAPDAPPDLREPVDMAERPDVAPDMMPPPDMMPDMTTPPDMAPPDMPPPDMTPDGSDMAVDEGPDYCGECMAGDARCDTRPGGVTYQTCQARRDDPNDPCYVWVDEQQCTSSQTCSAANGCECPDACVADGVFDCTANPPTLCVVVDGCPTRVEACMAAGCGSMSDPAFCAGNPSHPLCSTCGGAADPNGRSCQLACPGTACYSCGIP